MNPGREEWLNCARVNPSIRQFRSWNACLRQTRFGVVPWADWWSAEGFEFSEAKPSPVKPDVCRPCAYLDPLVHCTHLCTQTVRWNGGLRQLPRGP